MKIAVVGCGALGSYYGGKLHQARLPVHFLLRSDYHHVKQHGVQIKSPQGDFHFHPRIADTPQSIGPCDLVIVSLKTTANDQLKLLVAPLVNESTTTLCLQNGLGNIEQLSEFIPLQQILGGLCFICVNRTAPGSILHLDHGQIVIGEAQGWPEPRTHELAALFQNAGIPSKVTDTLPKAQWEKLVWNIPFNGLGVAASFGHSFFASDSPVLPPQPGPALTTEELLTDKSWLSIVQSLMHEIISVANELGYPVNHELADLMIRKTRTMKQYRPSTVIDFALGRPIEYDSMFRIPYESAKSTNLSTPILSRLHAILRTVALGNQHDEHH